MTMEESTSALRPSQRLRVAYLLSVVGGFLDAYTFFERGGVFANAQTGNIVRLGIALANGTRDRYLFFLIPVCTFGLGIAVSLVIEGLLERRGIRLVRRCVLGVEIAVLAIVAFLPLADEWNMLANCLVTFVSALQFETFRTFHGKAINTMMSTGNLKKFVENLYSGIADHDRAKLRSAGIFITVLIAFTLGAFLGTRTCDHLNKAAVVPAISLLAVTIATITALHRSNTCV